MVSVTPVRGRAQRLVFVRLPYRLHRHSPHWVPPLERERLRFLDPATNPFFDHGEVELFVARRHGDVVGRIAAVVNRRHNELHHPWDGFFGLFDAIDDVDVAAGLLDVAGQWLRAKGFARMIGPTNFTINHECGVLVDGFHLPPAILTPYNPSYYPFLLEACGFTKAKDLWGWHGSVNADAPAGVARAADWAARQSDVHIRTVDMRRFSAELMSFRDVYNEAWRDNWFFAPLTARQIDYLAGQLKPIVHPELLFIAEVAGQPAGMGLVVPDANLALRAAGGRLTRFGLPIGLIRMARAARRIRHIRVIAMGVRPEFRRRGLDALLYTRMTRAAHRLGYETFEISQTLEDNDAINHVAVRLGATRAKIYRLYQRPV